MQTTLKSILQESGILEKNFEGTYVAKLLDFGFPSNISIHGFLINGLSGKPKIVKS